MAVHQTQGSSLVVDSINKVAWAGLRVGWVRADVQTLRELRTSRALADLFSPIPPQLMALAVLDDLDVVLLARVALLSRRASLLREEVARRLPAWALAPIRGGLTRWAPTPHCTPHTGLRPSHPPGVAFRSEERPL